MGLLYTGDDYGTYTGDDYGTLSGKQIKAVAQMINTLVRADLLEVPTERAAQP